MGKGLAAVVRTQYSRWVLFIAVGLVFVANTLSIGADLGAMAATAQLLVPGAPFLALLLTISLGILVLEVFVPYKRYVATGLIVGPQGVALLQATVVPNIQLTPAFLALVVGVLGTAISPYLFFWQASEEVEEFELRHWKLRGEDWVRQRQSLLAQIRLLRIDTALGMLSSETATWFIIFTTGSVLHAHGMTNITTADQAAAALEPLVHSVPNAGLLAKLLFATGILGVGLLGIPALAGSAAYVSPRRSTGAKG
jgi:Mn2+/Fe2+ NRAMP family transporter